jgi:uncharacterized protein YihD (DUF1040 family)
MPRDPNRIPEILTLVQKAWEELPDLRLGQLLMNVTGNRDGIYYVEDDVLLDDLKEWAETSQTWRARDDDSHTDE